MPKNVGRDLALAAILVLLAGVPGVRAQAGDPTAQPAARPATSDAPDREWATQIMAHLRAGLRHPRGVTEAGIVKVQFRLNRSGRILSTKILESSGVPALDAAALAAFRRPFPPAPRGSGPESYSFVLPVRFVAVPE